MCACMGVYICVVKGVGEGEGVCVRAHVHACVSYETHIFLTMPATFERALGDNFQSSGDYLAVWTAYCDYYRRRASGGEGETPSSGSAHGDLLALFTRAKSKLMEGKVDRFIMGPLDVYSWKFSRFWEAR